MSKQTRRNAQLETIEENQQRPQERETQIQQDYQDWQDEMNTTSQSETEPEQRTRRVHKRGKEKTQPTNRMSPQAYVEGRLQMVVNPSGEGRIQMMIEAGARGNPEEDMNETIEEPPTQKTAQQERNEKVLYGRTAVLLGTEKIYPTTRGQGGITLALMEQTREEQPASLESRKAFSFKLPDQRPYETMRHEQLERGMDQPIAGEGKGAKRQGGHKESAVSTRTDIRW
jgi:hypothetical protein